MEEVGDLVVVVWEGAAVDLVDLVAVGQVVLGVLEALAAHTEAVLGPALGPATTVGAITTVPATTTAEEATMAEEVTTAEEATMEEATTEEATTEGGPATAETTETIMEATMGRLGEHSFIQFFAIFLTSSQKCTVRQRQQ